MGAPSGYSQESITNRGWGKIISRKAAKALWFMVTYTLSGEKHGNSGSLAQIASHFDFTVVGVHDRLTQT